MRAWLLSDVFSIRIANRLAICIYSRIIISDSISDFARIAIRIANRLANRLAIRIYKRIYK